MDRHQFCRILGASVLLGAAGFPAELEAKPRRGNRNKRRRPSTKKGAPSELPTVQRVGAGIIRVNGKDYEVTDDTKITVNGVEAPLSRVKAGMQVRISGGVSVYGKGSRDTLYKATRIEARKNDNLKKKAKQANKGK